MDISGAKFGGGSFKTTPDNLRSNDTLEALLGICAGPVVGPKRGLKSITIDGTPLEGEDGNLNFENFHALVADGDPAKHPQRPTMQLGGGSSPVNVGLSLTNTNSAASGLPGPWVVKTAPNTGANAIDIRIVVSQLYYQNKRGIFETTANLEIEMKPVGSTTWVNPVANNPSSTYNEGGIPVDLGNGQTAKIYIPEGSFDGTGAWLPVTNPYFAISGKTTSPYVWELRVAVPNAGAYAGKGWDVRIRLREPEDVQADPEFTKRTISWESVSAVYTDPLGGTEAWRGLAWMYLFGKASDQLVGVPEISGPWDTKIVSVPGSAVYNPTTRQYTGAIWDGSYTKAFTDDPAWIVNDAISDSLFGVSYLAPGSYLNKWDALEASKWFSELVPDGNGGYEPRFSLNMVVDQPQKVDELIQYMAGAVGGLAWDTGNGEWRLKVDKPERPVDIFTLENIEGDFRYSHTDIDTRYNDITLSFLNKEFDYREDRVRVFDQAHIDKYGRKPVTVVAVGCTGRQEALRRGMLRLRTSINEWRSVSFVTNRRGRMIQPLSTILIADSSLGYTLPTGVGSSNPADLDTSNNRTTGRVVAYDSGAGKITLRDSVRLEIGASYTLTYSSPNPDYNPNSTTEDRDKPTITTTVNITNNTAQRGDVKELYISGALPGDIPEYAVVAISAAGLPSMPKAYRVLAVKPDDDGERVAITAIEIDSGKWAAADNVSSSAIALQTPDAITPPPLPPIAGDILTPSTAPTDGAVDRRVLNVNWQRPSSLFISGFRVGYKLDGGQMQIVADNLQDTSFELTDPTYGTYQFYIWSIDRRGQFSQPLLSTIELDEMDFRGAGVGASSNRICNSMFEADTFGWAIVDKHASITANPLSVTTLGGYQSLVSAFTATASAQTLTIAPSEPRFRFPVTGEERLSVQAMIAGIGALNTVSLRVNWYDASGALISDSLASGTAVLSGTPTAVAGFVTAPELAVTGELRVSASTSGSGSCTVYLARPMVAQASASQTIFPSFVVGPSIGAASPAMNRVFCSGFEVGIKGWGLLNNASGLATSLTTAVFSGMSSLVETVTATAANQNVTFGAASGYFFPVNGQERLAVQALLSRSGVANNAAIAVSWYDSSGALLSTSTVTSLNSVPTNNTLVTGFTTAPVSAVTGQLRFTLTTTGAGSTLLRVARPMVSQASPNQSDFPPFTLGPTPGASALSLRADRYNVTYDWKGAANPTLQPINFTATVQNSNASVTWSLTDMNGAARSVASYLSVSGNTASMTELQFSNARNGTEGVIVSATITDGVTVTESVSVVRAVGAAPGIAFLLSNEDQTIPTDQDGNNGVFTNANGVVRVLDAYGTDYISEVTFGTATGTGCVGTVNTAANTPVSGQPKGYYQVTSMTAGVDSGVLTIPVIFAGQTVNLRFTVSKNKQGTAAKTLDLTQDRYTIAYGSGDTPNPTIQTTTFTAVKQNTTAAVTWSVTDANGVARTPLSSYLTASGDTATMSEAQFALARNSTSGVVVSATLTDGTVTLTDKANLTKVKDGANGLAFFLTNPNHTVATDSSGAGGSYSGATGLIKILDDAGNNYATAAGTTIGTPTFSGCVGTVNTAANNPTSGQPKGYYAVSSTSADTATMTIPVTYNGQTVNLVFTVSRSKQGIVGNPGASAKTLNVGASQQVVTFDAAGAASPAGQSVTFTANKQNTTSTVNWTLTDYNGTTKNPATFLSAITGDSVTMSAANFNTAAGTSGGVIVTATLTDGATTLTDKVSIVRLTAAANGLNTSVVKLFKRSATSPSGSMPTGTFSYEFATGLLSGTGTYNFNGWSQTVPAANNDPLWVITAVAASSASAVGLNGSSFSSPVMESGAGISQVLIQLFQRAPASPAPAKPSGDVTVNLWTNGTPISGPLGSWVRTPPAANGYPLWTTMAYAFGATQYDTISTGEWSDPQIYTQDGDDALDVQLTKSMITLPVDGSNAVTSYALATGDFKIRKPDGTDVSSNFTLSTDSNPQALTVSYTGQTYNITGGFDAGENAATVIILATGSGAYAGYSYRRTVTLSKSVANTNVSNDRISTAVVAPTVSSTGAALEASNNADGSVNITFQWSWAGTEADIDGFEIIVRQSLTGGTYFLGSNAAEEQVFTVPANKRSFVLPGVAANLHYSFFVRAYRIVDTDINAAGIMRSTTANSTATGEFPFQPATTPNYTGNVNGTGAATIATAVTNFNARNDRLSSAVVAPNLAADGSCIDHAPNNGGASVDISFEWGWSGTEADIDGFEILHIARTSNTAYVLGSTVLEENVVRVPADRRSYIIYGASPTKYYTFAVRAYRSVDPDVATGGVIYSAWVRSTTTGENPYQPASTAAFDGNISGTINGTPATTVSAVAVNFNARNDRNSAAVLAPSVVTNGTAVDHTPNTDGSVDISFEWTWSGSNADIDDFEVVVVSRTDSGLYTIGSNPAIEQHSYTSPDQRSFILQGVPANLYYTFAVRAVRIVDPDISASGRLVSAWAQPSAAATGGSENPYRPSSSVAFLGDISQTVGYAPISSLPSYTIDVYKTWGGGISVSRTKNVKLVRMKGNTDVSSLATWTVTTAAGLTCSVDSTGLVTVTAALQADGIAIITSTYEGIDIKHVILTNTILSVPPAAAGRTLIYGPSYGLENVSVTTETDISEIFNIRSGPTGCISYKTCNAVAKSLADAALAGSFSGAVLLYRRPIGGSFVQVDNSSFNSSSSIIRPEGPSYIHWYRTNTFTGLSPNTDYEFKLTIVKGAGTPSGVVISKGLFFESY